ncbi:hypothetical protein CCHR01_04862 [Colletotrichum chrysophilum]|uniref:Uncharacterized protein n=1 Tax=Colletotrichum chrysophilum TaxID=1836956 RepID=A0AAD9EM61_9PEZI|nr:hypothetical protein CCHR01_04862 [Colletotrichum chrysophilum]
MPQAPLSPTLNYTIMTTSSPSSLPPKNPSPAIVDTNARPPRTKTSRPDPGASEHQHKPCNQPRGSKGSPTQLTFPAPLLANKAPPQNHIPQTRQTHTHHLSLQGNISPSHTSHSPPPV